MPLLGWTFKTQLDKRNTLPCVINTVDKERDSSLCTLLQTQILLKRLLSFLISSLVSRMMIIPQLFLSETSLISETPSSARSRPQKDRSSLISWAFLSWKPLLRLAQMSMKPFSNSLELFVPGSLNKHPSLLERKERRAAVSSSNTNHENPTLQYS